MRVYMIPMDQGACGYFRVREPARIAKAAGVDVWVTQEHAWTPEKYRGVPVNTVWDPASQSDVLKDVMVDCDVMVIQRPLMQPMWAIARRAKQQGIKIIVELDDDLHAVHRRNTVAAAVDPKRQPLHNTEWVQRVIDMADLLVVSTPALTRYGPQKSVVVRNWLPEHILPLAPDVSPVRDRVGWTGAINVHPEDLQSTGGGLRNLPHPFVVVGNEHGVARALSVPEDRVTLGAAWRPSIPDYWAAVTQTIGVGVAPLEDSKFNRAKSALKPQEYSALGIPWVASPLPEYMRLAEQSKAGLIARSRGQWQRMTRRLLNDDDLYGELRANGLAWSKENTLERHIDEHIAAWEKVLAG